MKELTFSPRGEFGKHSKQYPFDFPNTLLHFVLAMVIDRTSEHKKSLSHQNLQHNLGHKVTNFFLSVTDANQAKVVFSGEMGRDLAERKS